jgi:beta-galactosidase GanA
MGDSPLKALPSLSLPSAEAPARYSPTGPACGTTWVAMMKHGMKRRARSAGAGMAALLVVVTLTQMAGAAKASGGPLPARPAAASGTASGSDASCPAASPAEAASGIVSPPAEVKAISGSNSATVVWCPPESGAGPVVSYTVTSSGGQQVTAAVPNDWAIIDGLPDGASYTFTVRANTKPGASGPAARSNPVTPRPITPPADVLRGSPQKVTYDQYSLMIGGKRVFVYAGEFDPWRTPSPSLWLDDLEKMKAGGYNAVSVYFDWDYTSPSPGVYDFSGVRDMNEFLNLAQQAGLYVIARPGPNINAETDGGGIPSWVLTSPNGYRSDAEPYLSAALQWLSEIDSIIAPHQITRGGDVILYQVENEYTGSSAADVSYIADLVQQARSDGINVPLTFNEPDYSTGPAAVNISGQDSYPRFAENCSDAPGFGNPPTLTVLPGEPFMSPEYQAGSLEYWGTAGFADCYHLTGPDFENVYYKDNLAQGITIQSNYMGAGGTNWGWLPDPEVYTSYDYGAAISETGELGTPSDPDDIAGSKYGENKLIGDFAQAAAPLTKTVPAAAPVTSTPAVTAMSRANPGDGTQFIYLRQASASSTATVSTHLSLDLDQNGTCTYDDMNPALRYSGDWTHAGPSTAYDWDYDHTESWSSQPGAGASVRFTGTAVQWIGPRNTNGGIADVYLDGKLAAAVDTYTPAGKQPQQVLFSDRGLAAGPHTLQIVVTGQKNAASSADTVVIDAVNVPGAAEQAGYYPVVPQSGAITLDGRDSRMLVGSYNFGGQHLVYSTSELMTQASIGGHATAVLYDPAGTDGETVLRYAGRPTVRVLSGSVRTTWDASRGDLRLDYVHDGLTRVEISGGGTSPLLLLLTDTSTAEGFWPVTTAAGAALVEGGYLVRTATSHGSTLALTGDTSTPGPLVVWAPATIRSVTWNGRAVAVTSGADGRLSGTVPGPAPVTLPALTNWRFAPEAPEAQPGFDDRSWTLADDPVSNKSSPATPVLYASDYGYDHGFVWYRGHFPATGTETGITLEADGMAPTGAYSVWLNGAFLGSGNAAGVETRTFGFPAGAVDKGKDNVIAVLVENTGNPEGPSGEKAGLYGATLAGSAAPVTWRLMGDPGGTTLQDPVRGIMNASGLYGSDHGWDLPGYPDRHWQDVTLPDSWPAREIPPGIGWYRTSFSLHLPRDSYVPVDVQIGGAGPEAGTADYRAFICVNGWMMGQYVNTVGPQHRFYLPAGILNDHGGNTLAIAVWGLNADGGGLGQVSLVAAGNQAGGVPVQQVRSPRDGLEEAPG